ncbi:MAG: hydantoinase/oxoprolinase family protein [Bacteroidales bacterium]
MRKIKVGIDVGGTFTHAVAVDVEDFNIIGKACVPTTHNSQEGVAEGVVESMYKLLDIAAISPDEIVLIAHSTTQATNALLEGDVSPVGIVAIGHGLEGKIAQKQAFMDNIYLAPDKRLPVFFRYLNDASPISEEQVEKTLEDLVSEGAEVFVATQVFGPENNEIEKLVVNVAHRKGYMATAACNLSQLFGLKVRTRTAIINACMMPKMMETANMTEEAIRKSGIKAPLMVMRSDGGIMDIEEMRKRPILTMLSGPAAGVAAALMYAKISDGIFIEVGGTSTDISVIKNGMPQVKTAQIASNRLSIKTIDVRTIGVGGGSVPRVDKNKIVDVGPRSAHIANLAYCAYSDETNFEDVELGKIQPKQGDPEDYLKLSKNGRDYTITPSAASYYLGLVKDFGHGEANMQAVKEAIETVAGKLKIKPEEFADGILDPCSHKIETVVKKLIREYKLDKDFIALVGGGGGASALVPHASDTLKLPHNIARDAEVISAIGAAMGMIRDTVERSIFNPTENDIVQIRQDASESVIAMGAEPSTVEVHVEVDNPNRKVVAVATGSSDLSYRESRSEVTEEGLKDIAAKNLKTSPDKIKIYGKTKLLNVVGYENVKSHFLGLMKETLQPVLVMDNEGTIKRKFPDVRIENTTVGQAKGVISDVTEELRSYGDAGELIPDIFVVVSGKIVDLSGLLNIAQILSLVDYDLKDLGNENPAIVLAKRQR